MKRSSIENDEKPTSKRRKTESEVRILHQEVNLRREEVRKQTRPSEKPNAS